MSGVYPARSVATEEDEVEKGNQSPFPGPAQIAGPAFSIYSVATAQDKQSQFLLEAGSQGLAAAADYSAYVSGAGLAGRLAAGGGGGLAGMFIAGLAILGAHKGQVAQTKLLKEMDPDLGWLPPGVAREGILAGNVDIMAQYIFQQTGSKDSPQWHQFQWWLQHSDQKMPPMVQDILNTATMSR